MKSLVIFLSLLLASSASAEHKEINWKNLHGDLDRECSENEARCVGHSILKALELTQGQAVVGGGPNFQCRDLSCVCDSAANLSCSVGTGSLEREIKGKVFVGNNRVCENYRKIIKKRCRACDSSATLWRADLGKFEFIKGTFFGRMEKCEEAMAGE